MRSSWNFSPNSAPASRSRFTSTERDMGAHVHRHAAAILRMIRQEGGQKGTHAEILWAELPAMVHRALRPGQFEEDANALLQALLNQDFTLDARTGKELPGCAVPERKLFSGFWSPDPVYRLQYARLPSLCDEAAIPALLPISSWLST